MAELISAARRRSAPIPMMPRESSNPGPKLHGASQYAGDAGDISSQVTGDTAVVLWSCDTTHSNVALALASQLESEGILGNSPLSAACPLVSGQEEGHPAPDWRGGAKWAGPGLRWDGAHIEC